MSKKFENFVKTFKPAENLIKPDKKTIKQFKNVLPQAFIEFWNKFGFGNYADGLIKIINPSDYMESLHKWLAGGGDDSRVPIAVTGFGDIFYYRKLTDEDEDVSFLDIHHRNIEVCVWGLEEFFDSFIVDEEIIDEMLRKKLFDKAKKVKGNINYDEIYYFVPALIMGGSEDINHIDKGIGTVHHSILFQIGNRQLINENKPVFGIAPKAFV